MNKIKKFFWFLLGRCPYCHTPLVFWKRGKIDCPKCPRRWYSWNYWLFSGEWSGSLWAGVPNVLENLNPPHLTHWLAKSVNKSIPCQASISFLNFSSGTSVITSVSTQADNKPNKIQVNCEQQDFTTADRSLRSCYVLPVSGRSGFHRSDHWDS